MSREWGVRIFFGLIGAAFGAAITDVQWTFWLTWAVAFGAWFLVAHWHRNGHINGDSAHA